MTIAELNALNHDEFVRALGGVFEHSPWVAERTWNARPFPDLDTLHSAMVRQVEQASPEETLALLRAHPDLGTRARMSSESVSEQAGAGLDQLTPDEFERLRRLNAEYREKFGFPFLLAVKGSTKYDVLAGLASRLENAVEQEYAEALRQVYRIARFRLQAMIAE